MVSEGYYGGRNIGPTLIVSQEYLESLTDEPYTLGASLTYEECFNEDTEKAVRALIDGSPAGSDLLWESTLENMKTVEESQGSMMQVGTALSLLLLLIGALNYINTMTVGIQNRKLTFAIMESVGMSPKQMRMLLVREGLLYGGGSIFLTLTAGTVVTYICFQALNYMDAAFTVPVLPVVCAFALVLFICIVVPLAAYRNLVAGRELTERMRE